MPFFKRFRILSLVFFAVLITTLCAILLFPYLQESHQQDTGIPIKVSINISKPGATIPPDFVGFGFEFSEVCNIINVDEQNSKLSNLLANLGSATLPFGGNSVEYTYWSPTGVPSCSYTHTVITPSLIDGVFALAKKLHWKVIWGENLKNGDSTIDADEVAYVYASGGSALLAIEIGNEPDLYGWEYSTFKGKWDTFASAIKARSPLVPLSGPATLHISWFTKFLNDHGASIFLATHHLYPMGPNNSSQTISKLLSPALVSNTVASIDQLVSNAQAYNLPLQIDETNNISSGGTLGVSNIFASALWGADYLFTASGHNVAGVDLFTGTGASYDPLYITGNSVSIKPLYYGMLFFHYVVGNGHVIPTQVSSPLNVTAYAVLGSDGKLRIALINKEQQKNVTVQLNTSRAYKVASLIRLIAPSLSATNGITLGGSTVATNGTWTPKTKEPVSINHGIASVFLPAASALVVTFENGNSVSSAFSPPRASQAIPQQPEYLHRLFEQEQQTVFLFLLSPSIFSLPRQKLQKRGHRAAKLNLKRTTRTWRETLFYPSRPSPSKERKRVQE
jgi:Glycosyl hydrolase family 79 C-terminal beta domain/Glycosyl hydrolase family 79, N-terminal domain